MTIEAKLVKFAGFVNKGGDVKRVIRRYAKDREETYRSPIHWVLLQYIERMMVPPTLPDDIENPTSRIMCLNNDELIRLFTELLKDRVRKTCDRVSMVINGKMEYRYKDCWEIDNQTYDDSILSRIEEDHRRAHPHESEKAYKARSRRWANRYCFF